MEMLALEGGTSIVMKKRKDECIYPTCVFIFIVMLRKALNEVDDEEEEGTINNQSGESENELDNSLNSPSNMNVDRYVYVASVSTMLPFLPRLLLLFSSFIDI